MNIRPPVPHAVARDRLYVPAIDGLRAVAIVLVVAFHAGVPLFSGGFVGVDVFFVISGYLITGLLADELGRTGRIDLLEFYARRARRLLPALALVTSVTLGAGVALLAPVGQQQDLAQSAIAASGFLANIFFWRSQSGYFGGAAEEMPLLHLWTLAVEEQFYLVWPLAMTAVAAIARRAGKATSNQTAIIAFLTVASGPSFLASWRFTFSHATLAFYTPPFRAWEFGCGALLALSPSTAPAASRFGPALVSIGAVAIAGADLFFDRDTIFPGAAAALPVLGATALLAGIRISPASAATRVLASRPFVAIGKLSYSRYLWHWPLLAIARATAPRPPSLGVDILLVAAALGLAALTFHFVEEPVRRSQPGPFAQPRGSVLTGAALMAGTAIVAAALWTHSEWRTSRDPVLRAAAAAMAEKVALPVECSNFRIPYTGLAYESSCIRGRGNEAPLVLLWGDSHAFHYIPALMQWADFGVGRFLPRAMGACKPHVVTVSKDLPGRAYSGASGCVQFNSDVESSLTELRHKGLGVVILSAQWSKPGTLQTSLGDWEQELRFRVSKITREGLKVVLIADVPKFQMEVPRCIAERGTVGCARKRAEVDSEREAALGVLRRVAEDAGAYVWDPVDTLCDADICPVFLNGVVLYSDNNHLSVRGAEFLTAPLNELLLHVLESVR